MPLRSFSVVESVSLSQQFYYHKGFHNDESVCHVCSLKNEISSVRIFDTAELIRRFAMLV